MLTDLAGPEVEIRLFELALRELESLPAERLKAIRQASEATPEEAEVVTAYPLLEPNRRRLAEKLGGVLEMPVPCHFVEDSLLLAGLRITLGAWVFHANLQDELKSFAISAHAAN